MTIASELKEHGYKAEIAPNKGWIKLVPIREGIREILIPGQLFGGKTKEEMLDLCLSKIYE